MPGGLFRSLSERREKKRGDAPVILDRLSFYRKDATLRRRWDVLVEAWRIAFPDVDIDAEVASAHAHEVATNPRANRLRYLDAWMRRAQEYAVERRRQSKSRAKGEPGYSRLFQAPTLTESETLERRAHGHRVVQSYLERRRQCSGSESSSASSQAC